MQIQEYINSICCSFDWILCTVLKNSFLRVNFSGLLSGENCYVSKSGHCKDIFPALTLAVVIVHACNTKKRAYLVQQGLHNLIYIDFKDSFLIKHLFCFNKNHSQQSWISSLQAFFLKWVSLYDT